MEPNVGTCPTTTRLRVYVPGVDRSGEMAEIKRQYLELKSLYLEMVGESTMP